MRGKIDRFTIDVLVNMLSRLGVTMDITIKKAA
jgi:predicted XRE-type DNA-binding protein